MPRRLGEYTGHRDYVGSDLYIGDRVAFSKGGNAKMRVGYISGFSKRMVVVSSSLTLPTVKSRKRPVDLIKVVSPGGDIVIADDLHTTTDSCIESTFDWFHQTWSSRVRNHNLTGGV